ncbi:MAG: hypothetical protein GY870_10790 [archaeon]|nr:hypothetical protein [archaeon]
MITRIGICTSLIGLFVGLFTGISNFMNASNFWVDLTISKIIGEKNSEAIIMFMDAAAVQNFLDFMIYDLPFFIFLIGVGVIILIISLFVKTH